MRLSHLGTIMLAAWGAAPALGQAPGSAIQCALETKILPSGGAPGDNFGFSIAVSGDTVVAGAPYHDAKGTDSGAAYVFVRSGSAWIEEAKLLASDGIAGDEFGRSVAIWGDTILVGAPLADFFNFDQGAAYVFERSGTAWTQKKKLVFALSQGTEFGHSVAMDGGTIAIGALENWPGAREGSVYVYQWSGSNWILDQQLRASDGQPNYGFGQSVSVSPDRILVGAPGAQSGAGYGAGYAFSRQRTQWVEEAKLVPPNSSAVYFGYSVSISGDTAVVGAWRDTCAGTDAGAAYVFVDQGTTWALQQKLVGSDTTGGDRFGQSVSLIQDRVLIGAPGDDIGAFLSAGSAYVFSRSGTLWTEIQKLPNVDPELSDIFGWAVSLGSKLAAAGVLWDDDNGNASGSAYVFHLIEDPVRYCTAKVNSCGTTPAIISSGSPSATGTGPFLVSASSTRAQKFGLLLYTDSGRANAPFSGGILCLGTSPLRRSVAVVDTSGTPGQCDGTLSLDMNAFATGALGGNPLPSLTVPGTQVNCQFWGRDTLANGALLTDALEYFICD